MAKNLMSDMVKVNKIKSETFLKKLENKSAPKAEIKSIPKINKALLSEKDIYTHKKKHHFSYKIWLVAVSSLVFLFLSVSYVFSKAEVSINPKIEDKTLNLNLFANKDSNSPEPSFDLVVISGEEEQEVPSKEQKYIETKAKGVVVFYNKYSTASQTLNIHTQLEGSNGKLYKTEKRIVVPGMGKDGKPGQLEVGIYAANPGEEYNSAPLDFKILNFKNTAKYTKIYARSKTDIQGGIKGNFYTISDADKVSIGDNLKNNLQEKLLKKATEQIPKGFILFKDAVVLNVIDNNLLAYSKDDTVTLNFKGTLYGFLLDEKKLTNKIVKHVVDKYDGSDVFVHNLKDLEFNLVGKENMVFSDVNNINFTLKGDTKIVWTFDTDKFVNELLGKNKSDFSLVLSKYPNITGANLILKPFWRRSIPEKEDIEVKVNYPL